MKSAQLADDALRNWLKTNTDPNNAELSWEQYSNLIETIRNEIRDWPTIHRFQYEHPVRLQDPEFGVGKPYTVPLAYSDTSTEGEPLIAIGGLTNVAQRFDFLSLDIQPDIRLVGLDLSGRGQSGWMAEISDYSLETYVEQLKQLMDHLELESCSLLGSSLGGSTAICFAAEYPQRVKKIILNDSGPFIPVARRGRRSRAVARHYVFLNPSELFRRTGASSKNVGPAPDIALLHSSHHKTRWSDTENGRVYRHDLRAMLAYRQEATQSLDLWRQWNTIECPVLLIHGRKSDAMTDETIDRMRSHHHLSVVHVEEAGHTPALVDRKITQAIKQWLRGDEHHVEDRHIRVDYNPIRVLYPDARRSKQS